MTDNISSEFLDRIRKIKACRTHDVNVRLTFLDLIKILSRADDRFVMKDRWEILEYYCQTIYGFLLILFELEFDNDEIIEEMEKFLHSNEIAYGLGVIEK
jgi:hypothetical protein